MNGLSLNGIPNCAEVTAKLLNGALCLLSGIPLKKYYRPGPQMTMTHFVQCKYIVRIFSSFLLSHQTSLLTYLSKTKKTAPSGDSASPIISSTDGRKSCNMVWSRYSIVSLIQNNNFLLSELHPSLYTEITSRSHFSFFLIFIFNSFLTFMCNRHG